MLKANVVLMLILTINLSIKSGEEQTIFHLDFEKGLKNNNFEFVLRSTAKLIDDPVQGKVLKPVSNPSKHGNGIILKSGDKNKLQPLEDFTWNMKLKVNLPEVKKSAACYYLLDSRYSTNAGLSVYAVILENKEVILRAVIGHGISSEVLEVFKVKGLLDGKWHSFALELIDGCELAMFLDGKEIGRTVLTGKPVKPNYAMCIGDRVASGYGPFPGVIDEVKLTVPKQKKQ